MSAFPKKKAARERSVKDQVKAIFDKHGWFWWMPPANGYGQSGISDFGAVKDGLFMVVETKFGNNEPTALQYGYLNSVRAAGHFGFIVNEKTVCLLDVYLNSLDTAARAFAAHETVSPADGAAMVDALRAMMPDVYPALLADGTDGTDTKA